jgi:hypothetical protein
MKIQHSFLILILLILIDSSCKSQQVGARITANSVVIYNNSNSKISFLLGVKGAKPDTVNIKSNDVWFSPTYGSNPVIKIQTQKHISEYSLKLGNYYMVFWNSKNKYWDVKKTKPRQ